MLKIAPLVPNFNDTAYVPFLFIQKLYRKKYHKKYWKGINSNYIGVARRIHKISNNVKKTMACLCKSAIVCLQFCFCHYDWNLYVRKDCRTLAQPFPIEHCSMNDNQLQMINSNGQPDWRQLKKRREAHWLQSKNSISSFHLIINTVLCALCMVWQFKMRRYIAKINFRVLVLTFGKQFVNKLMDRQVDLISGSSTALFCQFSRQSDLVTVSHSIWSIWTISNYTDAISSHTLTETDKISKK